MKEHVLRYWPHGKPIPVGWVMVDDFHDIHHGAHAVRNLTEAEASFSGGDLFSLGAG